MHEQFPTGNPYPDLSDGLLIQKSLGGDQEAFAHLVERYHALLVGVVSHWCPDRFLVPDIVQGVLLQLYLSLPRLHPDRSLRAWLLRVAYHSCMSERRRRHPLLFSQFESVFPDADGSWLATLPDPDPSPEDLVEQHETQSTLFQAMQALPAKQRAVIWLRYMERLRYAEIAQRLHIPVSSAKTSGMRAKAVLRRFLSKESVEANNAPRPVW